MTSVRCLKRSLLQHSVAFRRRSSVKIIPQHASAPHAYCTFDSNSRSVVKSSFITKTRASFSRFMHNTTHACNMANSQTGAEARKLELTEVESTLRRLLMDVAEYNNPQKPSQLRYTGGWVRDKLLGVGSHDIDVAIDDMTGLEFGLKMKEYLELPDSASKYGLQGVGTTDESDDGQSLDKNNIVQGLHKIEANPEKSKHLETVTTKVFGLDIDLVNLRKETYTDDSRNPQMKFGTPIEDALRRDATINAMFYNLQTEEVEDLTGFGLQDMKSKLIRTPLEPYQTFKDDPLRVLRLIRFASRLGYTIDEDSKTAMKDVSIKEALELKISRERVGIELEKMLKDSNAYTALSLIDEMGLYNTIFTDPTTKSTFSPDVTLWRPSYQLINNLISHRSLDTLSTILLPDQDHKYNAWILSAFTPWFDAPQPQPLKPGGKIPTHPAVMAAREGIKATNKMCEIVNLAIRNVDEIMNLKNGFLEHQRNPQRSQDGSDPTGRDTLGMAIRRWGITWRSQVVFVVMLEISTSTKEDKTICNDWSKFLGHIQSLDLFSAYDFKPLIDGKALAKVLDTRPGPWMKEALDVVMAWQLRNPTTATAEGAIEAVKNKKGELVAVLIRHFLQLTIRPLFSKTQTPNITAQGRKVETTTALPKRYAGVEDEEVTRPWKNPKEAYAVELLAWILKSLDEKLTETFWPLLVPPVLKLLDDMDVNFKVKGCNSLSALMEATSPALLARTGLGEVFQEALEPCFTYLPTLSPEADSILLLNAAYPALLSIAHTKFPNSPAPQNLLSDRSKPQSLHGTRRHKTDFLSNIIHTHILPSINHISDSNPLIVATLLGHLSSVLQALGTDAISQLVHILPLLSSIMTMPFAAAEPTLLFEATKTMQIVIANAWPRIWFWRAEILKGTCGCWIQVVEEIESWQAGEKNWGDGVRARKARIVEIDSEQDENSNSEAQRMLERLRETQDELVHVVRMLVSCVEAMKSGSKRGESEEGDVIDIKRELKLLVDADDRLDGLFAASLTGMEDSDLM